MPDWRRLYIIQGASQPLRGLCARMAGDPPGLINSDTMSDSFLACKGKRQKDRKSRGGLENPVEKPAAIPLQGSTTAEQPHSFRLPLVCTHKTDLRLDKRIQKWPFTFSTRTPSGNPFIWLASMHHLQLFVANLKCTTHKVGDKQTSFREQLPSGQHHQLPSMWLP